MASKIHGTQQTFCPKAEALKVRKWTVMLDRGQSRLLNDCVSHVYSRSAAVGTRGGREEGGPV